MTGSEVGVEPAVFRLPAGPYPGLRPFEASEWMIFFGRETMIEDVIERLARARLVFIHGASGCGKSSLVRAGVLPKLERQHLSHGAAWHTFAIRPSTSPLWNLAAAFARLENRAGDSARIDEIVRLCNKRGATLAAIAGAIAGPTGRRLCILVDQFEEIFRFEREVSREEAELFIDLVIGASLPETDPDEPAPTCRSEAAQTIRNAELRIVVTMRSEFLGNCTRFDGLAETINRTQYLVPHMGREALLRAIRRPAQIYGGEVSAALAERLAGEVHGRDDELPLIQHGLMVLWNRAAARTERAIVLSLDMLDTHNSLARILSDHADAVAAAVAPTGRLAQTLETLFRSLADQTAERHVIRRPQRFEDLVAVANVAPRDLRSIIDGFRAEGASFLMPPMPVAITDATIIDISHEALIRCWTKIADPDDGWLKRETEDGLVWGVLRREAREFASNPKLVLSGAKLEERLRWLATKSEKWASRYGDDWSLVIRLLEASRREARRASRRQKLQRFGINAILSSLLLCILLVYGYFAGGDRFLLHMEDDVQIFLLAALIAIFVINFAYGVFFLFRLLLGR